MYYRNYGYKGMCPYCGGMHPVNQCPLMMFPPVTPMPSVPMPSVPMPSVPMPSVPMPSMPMPSMPMPSMPMPPMDYPMPDAGSMTTVMDMMMKHHQLLEHVACRVDEIYHICKEIHAKMAKG